MLLKDNQTRRALNWRRLDNAAKIFPPTCNENDPRVFRFACELVDEIDPVILQGAVSQALNAFPNFRFVMKKGVFWYYLEDSDFEPVVVPETKVPCSAIYNKDKASLLFEVSYFKNRINLEIFHVLSDGTGAMHFLKTIVTKYIYEKYSEFIGKSMPELDYGASRTEKMADSFRKYYLKNKKKAKKSNKSAYRIKGARIEAGQLQIIEGIVSVKAALAAAKKYNTTLTVFLTAVFMSAIHEDMPIRMENKDVVLMIPVNLRQFFPSETARNFFGMISVNYNYSKSSGEFEDILEAVGAAFKQELTKENLAIRMNSLAALEHNALAKIAPLPFKNLVMNLARKSSEVKETAVISNIGKVNMPEETMPFIDKFGVFTSTTKLQLCLCSFKDKLSLGFSSHFVGTDLQMRFFRTLTDMGIECEIRSNDFFPENKKDLGGDTK
ncbi:MAG: hypothetical protein GX896_03445 [Clostridiales bacterium]|nr:hypothetical protein [Clostridiales bacterium]